MQFSKFNGSVYIFKIDIKHNFTVWDIKTDNYFNVWYLLGFLCKIKNFKYSVLVKNICTRE